MSDDEYDEYDEYDNAFLAGLPRIMKFVHGRRGRFARLPEYVRRWILSPMIMHPYHVAYATINGIMFSNGVQCYIDGMYVGDGIERFACSGYILGDGARVWYEHEPDNTIAGEIVSEAIYTAIAQYGTGAVRVSVLKGGLLRADGDVFPMIGLPPGVKIVRYMTDFSGYIGIVYWDGDRTLYGRLHRDLDACEKTSADYGEHMCKSWQRTIPARPVSITAFPDSYEDCFAMYPWGVGRECDLSFEHSGDCDGVGCDCGGTASWFFL